MNRIMMKVYNKPVNILAAVNPTETTGFIPAVFNILLRLMSQSKNTPYMAGSKYVTNVSNTDTFQQMWDRSSYLC
jgi:hypothetical protein